MSEPKSAPATPPANLRGFVAPKRRTSAPAGHAAWSVHDEALHVLACECGNESHGHSWEEAGRLHDEYLREEAAKV